MRHIDITDNSRATRDRFLVRRLARPTLPITTIVSARPAHEELHAGARDLPC